MPAAKGRAGIVDFSHQCPSVPLDGLKPPIMLQLDALFTEHGVGVGVAVKADPGGVLDTAFPFVLTLRPHVLHLLCVTHLDDFNDSMVGWDEHGVRLDQLVKAVAEGALDSVLLPQVHVDEAKEALRAVGVATAEHAGRALVVGVVGFVANGALENLRADKR